MTSVLINTHKPCPIAMKTFAYYLGQLDKRAALFRKWAPYQPQTCLPFS